MQRPAFVTFTGADDSTSVSEMIQLSAEYPIEWAVLFSISRQNCDPRYPSMHFVGELISTRLRLAAHLCGEWTRRVIADAEDPLIYWLLRTCPLKFERIQINTAEAGLPMDRLENFAADRGARLVLQCRDRHPQDPRAQWLFDRSGGTGQRSNWMPPPIEWDRIVGYAGGITPENVKDVLAEIPAGGPFWIDMESGVRTDDRFDLRKCRAVCEAIWPEGVR